MLQTLKSGGIIMIPIILCGVIATYIIVNRLIYFASTKKRDKSLLQNVLAFMKNNDFDFVLCDDSFLQGINSLYPN